MKSMGKAVPGKGERGRSRNRDETHLDRLGKPRRSLPDGVKDLVLAELVVW